MYVCIYIYIYIYICFTYTDGIISHLKDGARDLIFILPVWDTSKSSSSCDIQTFFTLLSHKCQSTTYDASAYIYVAKHSDVAYIEPGVRAEVTSWRSHSWQISIYKHIYNNFQMYFSFVFSPYWLKIYLLTHVIFSNKLFCAGVSVLFQVTEYLYQLTSLAAEFKHSRLCIEHGNRIAYNIMESIQIYSIANSLRNPIVEIRRR